VHTSRRQTPHTAVVKSTLLIICDLLIRELWGQTRNTDMCLLLTRLAMDYWHSFNDSNVQTFYFPITIITKHIIQVVFRWQIYISKSHQCCQHQFTSVPLQSCYWGIACRDETKFELIKRHCAMRVMTNNQQMRTERLKLYITQIDRYTFRRRDVIFSKSISTSKTILVLKRQDVTT
jgi:hypothetical protein